MTELNPKEYELYSYMSMQSYQDNGGTPPEGWQVLGDSVSLGIGKDTGYYGVAYQNIEHPNQVVVAHRGTEFDKDAVKDGISDAQIGLHEVPAQFDDASKFVETIGERAHVPVDTITQTGQSLGGALAELGAAVTHGHAYAINPPGVHDVLADLESSRGVEPGTYQKDLADHITVYSVQGDLVSNHIGEHLGTVIPIENPNLPGQIEAREQLHDIAGKLVENIPHDDTRPIEELPNIISDTKAVMDGVENHSAAYAHALGQDMTAQERMGPIYGPPTTEHTPDHIPSKAEWAAGTGLNTEHTHDISTSATQSTSPDAPVATAQTQDTPSAPQEAAGTQTQQPDAFAATMPNDTATQSTALPDASTHTPGVAAETHAQSPDVSAGPQTPVEVPVHTPVEADHPAAQTSDSHSKEHQPLPDAFATLQPAATDTSTPTTQDTPSHTDANEHPPLPDAFSTLQQPPAQDQQAPVVHDAPTGHESREDSFAHSMEPSRDWSSSVNSSHESGAAQDSWAGHVSTGSDHSHDTGHSWVDQVTPHHATHETNHSSWVDSVSHNNSSNSHDSGTSHDSGSSHSHSSDSHGHSHANDNHDSGSHSHDSGHSGGHDSSAGIGM